MPLISGSRQWCDSNTVRGGASWQTFERHNRIRYLPLTELEQNLLDGHAMPCSELQYRRTLQQPRIAGQGPKAPEKVRRDELPDQQPLFGCGPTSRRYKIRTGIGCRSLCKCPGLGTKRVRDVSVHCKNLSIGLSIVTHFPNPSHFLPTNGSGRYRQAQSQT